MSPHNLELVERMLTTGPFPTTDGWHWLYLLFARLAPPDSTRRRTACRYFFPRPIERWGWGRVYRLLGVHLFGAVIPSSGA